MLYRVLGEKNDEVVDMDEKDKSDAENAEEIVEEDDDDDDDDDLIEEDDEEEKD